MNSVRRTPIALAALLAVLLGGAGCSTNPVTGEQELSLVSTEQELAIGSKNYGPYRQAEGGDYVLDPALSAYVEGVGQRLAKVSDRPLPYEFSIVNDSTPNAWALPGGKIALNRGLLVELQSEAELAAVLGHEIVHAAARHTAQGIQRGWAMQGALLAAGLALGDSRYGDLAMSGAQLGSQLVQQRYGRDAEREADFYGMQYMARAGYDPAAAVDLQRTFLRLAEGKEQNWLAGLFASHPPSQERVDNNRRTARELSAGGEIGRERYQRMIARLKRTKPAYDAYDAAREATAAGDKTRARALLDRAIDIEPEEALFWELRGELLAEAGDRRAALTAYDRAVRANPGYFRPYVMRGFLRRQLGDRSGAGKDFQRSLDLLPTAEARYGLGVLALDAGRRDEAVALFRLAASADSAVGKAASRDLARLDLAQNPGRYVGLSLGLDGDGYLTLVVENRAGVPIEAVDLVLGRRGTHGLVDTRGYRVDGRLGPGERRALRSRLGPMDAATARRYGAMVTGARLVE